MFNVTSFEPILVTKNSGLKSQSRDLETWKKKTRVEEVFLGGMHSGNLT